MEKLSNPFDKTGKCHCVLRIIFNRQMFWAIYSLDRFISFRRIQGNVDTSAAVMLKYDSLFVLFHQAWTELKTKHL